MYNHFWQLALLIARTTACSEPIKNKTRLPNPKISTGVIGLMIFCEMLNSH